MVKGNSNLYMAPSCQEKKGPIDRKNDNVFSAFAYRFVDNWPPGLAFVFSRGHQRIEYYASAPNIYQNWLSCQKDLWQSACRHWTASEYISVPLSRRSQNVLACLTVPRHPVRVSLGQGADSANRLAINLIFDCCWKVPPIKRNELQVYCPLFF
jgi:hypothetical protein